MHGLRSVGAVKRDDYVWFLRTLIRHMASLSSFYAVCYIVHFVARGDYLSNSAQHASSLVPLLGPGFAVEESLKLVPASVFLHLA